MSFSNKNIIVLSIVYLLFTTIVPTQAQKIGMFEKNEDIGNPSLKGNTIYEPKEQTYQMSAGGKNIWGKADQFQFIWKKIKGDFIIKATVKFTGPRVNGHCKLGIMARESLNTDSKYVDGAFHAGLPQLTSLQYRQKDGDTTGQVILGSNHPTEIEFERTGNNFILSAAVFGENYKSVTKEIPLNDDLHVGLFLCSHDESVLEKAIFSNVRIIIPPAKNYRPYRDYIGSHLEIMDIQSGHRKILHSVPGSIQAPNWTRDGKYLIYNSAEGLLYKYELANSTVSTLNSGFARDNNNDHVISPDGKKLAISNYTGSNRKSTIYIIPINGTDNPIKISSEDSGHSFLHSWSPDGKNILFTGQRNNEWDIWSINIDSKKETNLTNALMLDDGSEYSPDGKWIYFNSVRTGTMKLWRMKPDGSNQEQVTFDDYNDWFPHFSPDGKWIVYLSFPKEIDPASHPFYQKVYLRLMPAIGGVPKTIAYIYGGQGTINVPSWSPDSKRIAFVSNTNDK